MEIPKIAFHQGELTLDQMEETLTKLRFSLVILVVMIGFMYVIGAFESFQFVANIYCLSFAIFTCFRFLHLNSLHKCKTPHELTKTWKQIHAFALITSIGNSLLFAGIFLSVEFGPVSFFTGLAVIGMMVGGSSLYYHDSKFYTVFSLGNVFVPTLVLFFQGKESIILAMAICIFFMYLKTTNKLQNKFFWKAVSDNNFLNSMIDAIPSPVSILDKNLNFLKVNNALSDYYDLPSNEFVGRPLGYHNGFEQSKELVLFLKNFIQDSSLINTEKEISIDMAGDTHHFYFVVAKIKNSKNIACISHDLTDLKNAQFELEQQKAINIEASKLTGIGDMANSMAHEINNPLSIILGKSEQAMRALQEKSPDFNYLKSSLEIVNENVKRIAVIIQGLRTLSGEDDNEKFDTSLTDIMDQVELLSKERILSHGIALEISTPPSDTIYANPRQLAQVLLHTVNNAADAIHGTASPWIRIEFVKTLDYMEISISDSGQGIPIEISEKVFHPFFSTKELGKGMGLGLSVSKGIIDAHSGEFFIDNSCKNTRFVIRLPKLISEAA